jgi:hypothetical protein
MPSASKALGSDVARPGPGGPPLGGGRLETAQTGLRKKIDGTSPTRLIGSVDTTEKQSLLYQENAKVAATFWEWRHKIMTYTFSVIAALLGLTAWLHAHQHKAGWLEAVPIGFGGMLAFLAAGLDARNAQILHHCYRIGAEIESEWHNQTKVSGQNNLGGTTEL